MKHDLFSTQRRHLMTAGALGATALAVPGFVMAAQQPSISFKHEAGGKIVASGRVLGAQDGKPLAGAQIEIWRADARGNRAEAMHDVVTADGDGRYFAVINGSAHRLYYRVSHKGYVTRLAQLQLSGGQRSVTVTRDDAGVMRAAFEMKLSPRNALAAGESELLAL